MCSPGSRSRTSAQNSGNERPSASGSISSASSIALLGTAVRWCVERLLPRHRPCKVCNYTLSHTQVGSGPEASETAVLPHTPRAPRQEVKGGRSPTHPIDRFVHQFYLKTSFETRNVQKLPELQLSVRSGYVRQARSSGRAFTSPHASFHSAWNHVTLPSRCPRRPHRRRQARLGAHRGPRRWRP